MKIATIVGARPQFIKVAAVSRCIQNQFHRKIDEILVHTGQHYDENMSQVFFKELGITNPKYNLGIAGGTHGRMTGRMLEAIEEVLLIERPDVVLVYGDTNSTLAATLAAVKQNIPVAHVEAGLRSFNMHMPEEINRMLTDKASTYLFCPTETAVKNLAYDGINKGVHHVGDVMYDAALYFSKQATHKSHVLQQLDLSKEKFALATCHRQENTDEPSRLANILKALADIANEIPVVFPVHPRTYACIHRYELTHYLKKLYAMEPLSYMDMSALEQAAKVILTDSGGIQKEAFFYGVPCITMRNETEWVETLTSGWNQLVGTDQEKICFSALHAKKGNHGYFPYGDGNASKRIIDILFKAEHV